MHYVLTAVTKPGQELDDLMAPFSENAMGDLDPRFLEFVPDEDCEPVEEDETGRMPEVVGQRGYFTNPDGRWDWYVVGGRWSDRLLLKDGTRADSARVGDLDLDGMREEARSRAIRKLAVYRDAVEAHGPVPDMSFFDERKFDQERTRAFWDHLTLQAMKTDEVFVAADGSTRTIKYQTFDLDDLLWIAKSPRGWVEAEGVAAIVGHDVLTHEGMWMGKYADWRLDSRAERLNLAIGFYEAAGAYLSNLDEDMVVTSVDYHS